MLRHSNDYVRLFGRTPLFRGCLFGGVVLCTSSAEFGACRGSVIRKSMFHCTKVYAKVFYRLLPFRTGTTGSIVFPYKCICECIITFMCRRKKSERSNVALKNKLPIQGFGNTFAVVIVLLKKSMQEFKSVPV